MSNNAAAETYKPMDQDVENDSEMFEVVGTDKNRAQNTTANTFEEVADSAEDFEEDEDIPLVSGNLKNKKKDKGTLLGY